MTNYAALITRRYGDGRILIVTDKVSGYNTYHGTNRNSFWRKMLEWTAQRKNNELIKVALIGGDTNTHIEIEHCDRIIVEEITLQNISVDDLSSYHLLYFSGLPLTVSTESLDKIQLIVNNGIGLFIENPNRGGENVNVLSSIDNVYVDSSARPLQIDAYWTNSGVNSYVYDQFAKIGFYSTIVQSSLNSNWSVWMSSVQLSLSTFDSESILTDSVDAAEFGLSYIVSMVNGVAMVKEDLSSVSTQIVVNHDNIIINEIEGVSNVSFDYLSDKIYSADKYERIYGIFVSNLIIADTNILKWNQISWDSIKDDHSEIFVFVRSANSERSLGNSQWSNLLLESPSDISSYSGLYFQFMIVMRCDNSDFSVPILSKINLSYFSNYSSVRFFTKSFPLGFSPRHVLLTYNADETDDSVIRFAISGEDSALTSSYQYIEPNKVELLDSISRTSSNIKIMLEMVGSSETNVSVHEFALIFSGEDVSRVNKIAMMSSSSSSSTSSSSSSSSSIDSSSSSSSSSSLDSSSSSSSLDSSSSSSSSSVGYSSSSSSSSSSVGYSSSSSSSSSSIGYSSSSSSSSSSSLEYSSSSSSSSSSSLGYSSSSSSSLAFCCEDREVYDSTVNAHFYGWQVYGATNRSLEDCCLEVRMTISFGRQNVEYFDCDGNLVAFGQGLTFEIFTPVTINLSERNNSGITGLVLWDKTLINTGNIPLVCQNSSSSSSSSSSLGYSSSSSSSSSSIDSSSSSIGISSSSSSSYNWTPLEIAPVAWYDSSDTSTIIESSGFVTHWHDKSGSNNDVTQGAGGSQPVTGTRTVKTLNVLDFNGSSHVLSNTLGLAEVLESAYTLSVLVQADALGVVSIIVGGGDSTNRNPMDWLGQFSANVWRSNRRDTTNIPQELDCGTVDTSPHVLTVVFNGSNTKDLYIDGVWCSSRTNITLQPTTLDRFAIGAFIRSTVGNWFNGAIGEVVLTPRAESVETIGELNNYMVSKWLVGKVQPTEYDLVMGIGQSNMEGRGTSTQSPSVASSKGLYWNGSSLSVLADPVGGADTGSCVPAFVNKWYELTGRGVIYIEQATGGAALLPAANNGNGDFAKASGQLYNTALTAFNNAVSILGNKVNIANKILIWSQGEREAQSINGTTITGTLYQAALEELVDNFNSDISGGINTFLISSLGAQDSDPANANWTTIRNAQAAAAGNRALAVIAFNNAQNFPAEGKMKDDLNYNQTGYNEMGEGLAIGGEL